MSARRRHWDPAWILIDETPDTPERLVAHLERFVAMVVALASQEGDLLRKGGIIGLVLLA